MGGVGIGIFVAIALVLLYRAKSISYFEERKEECTAMGYGIKLEVWGERALFSRPEMKVERVSYDCITPSAARGLLEAIYWKPAIRWVIDRIYVCKPIAFSNIRRNELAVKGNSRSARTAMEGRGAVESLYAADHIQQRAAMVLTDVRYVIEAHFELTERAGELDSREKHYNMALRRMGKGQCFHQPCLGCREFPAHFRLWEDQEGVRIPTAYEGEKDLGFMLFDLDYSQGDEIVPMFFRAVLRDGVLQVRGCEVLR